MATRIRLKRIGRRNKPFYRVVVMDQRSRRDGAPIEEIGWYNPIATDKENNYLLKEERVMHWLKIGAQPSEVAHKLLQRSGIAFKWHLMKQGLDEKAIEKEIQKLDLRREAAAKEKAEAIAKAPKKKTAEAVAESTEKPVEEVVEKAEVKVEESTEVKADESAEKTTEEKPEVKAVEDAVETAAGKAEPTEKIKSEKTKSVKPEEVKVTKKSALKDEPKKAESAKKATSKDDE